MKKISPEEFFTFRNDYYNGTWTSQRLGQAFVNNFYPSAGEEVSDIFYEESSVQAEAMIERYVNY